MKKILSIFLILLLVIGCSKKENNNELKDIDKPLELESDEVIEEVEKYVDDNPIKIAFYNGKNGVYKRLDRYESTVKEMEVINTFSIILSNDEEVQGNSIKSLYNELKNNYSNIDNYKIGFNVKFTLIDGRVINENVFKPLSYGDYGFSHYLYAWIYDDVNTTGWHSHIEVDEYNDNTVMSSIKLMWGRTSNEIASDIELTVFTYDEDDFDVDGNYRGVSKFTTVIERR